MIIGVDAGNFQVKVISEKGIDIFPSDLGEYRERNLEQVFSENDMVVEYDGNKFFAGTLALYESEFGGSMMGESKAHEDCKMRILIALHRVAASQYKIIVGQPIGQHTKQEKEKIKNMLLGHHTIKINGVQREFTITTVNVAAEGGAAFWSSPQNGKIGVIDIGSGTVNCASLNNRRYIDRDSFTILLGSNTTKTKDHGAMARLIALEVIKKWDKNQIIYIVGGLAETIAPYLQQYLPNSSILCPYIAGKILDPVYANAVGFYRIGREIYDCQKDRSL